MFWLDDGFIHSHRLCCIVGEWCEIAETNGDPTSETRAGSYNVVLQIAKIAHWTRPQWQMREYSLIKLDWEMNCRSYWFEEEFIENERTLHIAAIRGGHLARWWSFSFQPPVRCGGTVKLATHAIYWQNGGHPSAMNFHVPFERNVSSHI